MIFFFFNYYLIVNCNFLLTTYIKNIIIYGILLISKRTVKPMNKSKKKGYLYSLKKALKEAKEVNDLRIRISKESPLVLGTTREEMDKKLAKEPEIYKKAMLAKLKK